MSSYLGFQPRPNGLRKRPLSFVFAVFLFFSPSVSCLIFPILAPTEFRLKQMNLLIPWNPLEWDVTKQVIVYLLWSLLPTISSLKCNVWNPSRILVCVVIQLNSTIWNMASALLSGASWISGKILESGNCAKLGENMAGNLTPSGNWPYLQERQQLSHHGPHPLG